MAANESAISCVVTTRDIGCPFAMGLPIVTISGTTSTMQIKNLVI